MLPFLAIGGSILSGLVGGAASGGIATTLGSIGTIALGSIGASSLGSVGTTALGAIGTTAIGTAAGSIVKGVAAEAVKTYTLEEAAKLYGAYYIGSQLGRSRERERDYQQTAQYQAQGRPEPKIICYIKTEDGLKPVYEG